MEAYSKTRTADAIIALRSLRPREALLLVHLAKSDQSSDTNRVDLEKDGLDRKDRPSGLPSAVEMIDIRLLEVGDIVRVQHGSTPPCDGTIVAGNGSTFDESSLTGESKPVKKCIGDNVFVGTINKSSVVDVRVDAIDGATMSVHNYAGV
jgi:Cu+-exporting ATPase